MSLPKAVIDQLLREMDRRQRHRHDSREGCRAINTDMQITSRLRLKPPFKIYSRAMVRNLNAQMVGGKTLSEIIAGGGAAHNILSVMHPDTLVDSIVTGDVFYVNATPKIARLPIDVDGKVLQIVGGLPVWGDPLAANHTILSATHSDTLADSIVAGDTLYGNSTPKLARLAKDSDGKFLKMVGGYPAWGDWGWNDGFAGASLGNWWESTPGNGTITVTGGELKFTCGNGVNCDWWGGATENAPYIQMGAPPFNWDLEIKVSNFSPATASHILGVLIVKDRDNMYYIGYCYDGSYKILWDKIVNDTGTAIGSAALGGLVIPYWLRIRRRGGIFYFDSSPDGSAWTNRYSQAKLEYYVNPLSIGVFAKNYSGFPPIDDRIDYAKLTVYYPLV